jgi:hypothetical protein
LPVISEAQVGEQALHELSTLAKKTHPSQDNSLLRQTVNAGRLVTHWAITPQTVSAEVINKAKHDVWWIGP